MRISVLNSDSGHANYLRLLERIGGAKHLIQITLDGKTLKNVLTADEELGEVYMMLSDTDGKLLLSEDLNGVQTRWAVGSVHIKVEGEE